MLTTCAQLCCRAPYVIHATDPLQLIHVAVGDRPDVRRRTTVVKNWGQMRRKVRPPAVKANSRQHRALGCRPTDRLDTDLAAMLALPPVAPAAGWRTSLRLPRDYYVRLASNDYSVHPTAVGRRVDAAADLQTVTVTLAGRVLAQHPRCWAKHQSITDPDHAAAAALLRQQPRALPPVEAEVEQRPLSDYDSAFGLTGLETVA